MLSLLSSLGVFNVYFHVNPYNTPHELVFKGGGGGREGLVTRRNFLVEIGVGERGGLISG